MGGVWPFTAEKIEKRLSLIEPLIHRRRQELAPFRIAKLPRADVNTPLDCDASDWPEILPNSYWGAADLNFILKNSFEVPA
ncbi:MAG: hypothetical protein AAFR27_12185, partial [Pseudomonadota bacterium]